MKFNFWGYDTKTMQDIGLDFNDLAFIQWFRDFKDSGNMQSVDTAEGTGYYVNYSKLIADIPVLFKGAKGDETPEDLVKIYNSNRQKANRMLKGPLSKLFKRVEKKEQGKTKIYLILNSVVFTSLINNGKNFNGKAVNMDTAVVKINIDNTLKESKKIAPATDGTDADANNVIDMKNISKDLNNNNSIPSVKEDVKTVDSSKEIDAPTERKSILKELGIEVTPDDRNNMLNGVDTDLISYNTLELVMNNIVNGESNIEAIDSIVINWSSIILDEAIKTTLASATKPNFNYVKKTYDSLVEKNGGVEQLEEKLLNAFMYN